MKHFISSAFFGLFILFSAKSCGQNGLAPYSSYFSNELKSWTNTFPGFKLDNFTNKTNHSFENIPYMEMDQVPGFYSIYKPALSFSADGKQFIDIYSWLNLDKEGKQIVSHGGEPEQTISLCNFKTKTWTRIAYFGTTGRIEEIIWISSTAFIMVGAEENEKEKYTAVIYVADIPGKTFTRYTVKNEDLIQKKGGYTSPKLKRLHIIEK